jgi:hypothetical protein
MRAASGPDCYCGPSFFVGSDGTPRIVSSGGDEIFIWKVQTDHDVDDRRLDH